jgi:hypothetical protein
MRGTGEKVGMALYSIKLNDFVFVLAQISFFFFCILHIICWHFLLLMFQRNVLWIEH